MKLHKRIIAGAMSFLLFLGIAFPSGAFSAWDMSWPALSNSTSTYQYGSFNTIQTMDGKKYEIGTNNKGVGKGTKIVEFPEETDNFLIEPEKYIINSKNEVNVTSKSKRIDLSVPQLFEVWAEDGRHYSFFMIGQSNKSFTDEDKENRLALAEQLASDGQRWWKKINEIEKVYDQKKVEVGSYHPVHMGLLYEIGRGMWGMAAGVQSYRDKGLSATEADYRTEIEEKLKKTDSTTYRAESLKKLLDVAVPYYLNYVEEHRIANPDILSFSIGDSKGVVDKENKTVTIRMPESTNWNNIAEADIQTEDGIKTNLSMGSLKLGEAIYVLTPWEETTGVTYDGVDQPIENGYGCGVNLSRQWTVRVEKGEPYNVVTSFAVTTSDGSVRYGEINDEDHTINLNLPVGTDISAVKPEVQHTGTGLQVDGKDWNGEAIDFSHDRTLTVVNSSFDLRQEYTVHVTAEESGKNDILSYKIGDSTGEISGENISITVPYGTDLRAVTPEIEISEFAKLTQAPDALAYDQKLIYQVTAENGTAKTYTVIITKAQPSDKAAIKVFRIGGIQGQIDESKGKITVEVPANVDITRITPTIETVESGTVVPASGEVMDFTNPVTYTVTSQSENYTRSYEVTVTRGAAGENPYKEQMSSLVDKIIEKYRKNNTSKSDDWSWMNIGFYQNKKATSAADLPENFDIAATIKEMDTTSNTAMTTIARKNMMLTALGVDTTNLDAYTEGESFTDSKGEEVHDLTSYIYNYDGGYTINGPAFALIALDMGNYTVPDNANWTREKLLDVLLDHAYGTDNFGIDMVGAIMYAIAPYQNDAVYGERVKAKLDEGLAIILGEQSAPNVIPMKDDLMFASAGTTNSEAAGWVIMALCSMGIDPHTDPRFVDGNGNTVISQYMTYADEVGFAHTATVRDNAIATYQAAYVMQWYLKFLENGGAGHPTYFYSHRFDFSRELSKEAEIKEFWLDGQKGEINELKKTVTVAVPEGTDLSSVTPDITLSDGAALKAPELPVSFIAGVAQPFTVVAEDGKTMSSYQVTVTTDAGIQGKGTDLILSSIQLKTASILKDVDILERKATKNSDSVDIVLKVGAEVNLADLYLSGTLSYGASTDSDILDGKTKVDLTDWNILTVTSEDGSNMQKYRIKATKQAVAGIEAFYLSINGQPYEGVIDDEKGTIAITGVPSDANVKSLAPEIILTKGTSVCSPLSGVAQNFSVPVTYTVSGDNMDSKTYTVSVTDANGNYITGAGDSGTNGDNGSGTVTAGTKITEFTLLGVSGEIDDAAGTVIIKLPAGTDVSAVAPSVTVSSGCTVSPVSGEVVDLTSPVTYTVTGNGSSSTYTVIVVLEESISQQLWDKVEDDSTVADHQVVK